MCPDWHCIRKWADEHADACADRLVAADYLKNDTMERILHVTLSWDPESDLSWMYSRKAFNARMREAYRLLMEVGLLGGVSVFHPFRWEGETGFERKGKRMPLDALKNGLRWFLGPHIHVVGPGWIDGAKVAEIHERTGIVIKVIASKNAEGHRIGFDDARSILAYCFSHAGVGSPVSLRSKCLRIPREFGVLSGRYESGIVRPYKFTETTNATCPICALEHPDRESCLCNLNAYMFMPSEDPSSLKLKDRFGLYCPKSSADRVRDAIAGMSSRDIMEYVEKNPDICFTRSQFPDYSSPKDYGKMYGSFNFDDDPFDFRKVVEAISHD